MVSQIKVWFARAGFVGQGSVGAKVIRLLIALEKQNLNHVTCWVWFQEILTDPDQFVLMTNSHISNTGVNLGYTSSWRCVETLGDYLSERNIMGICKYIRVSLEEVLTTPTSDAKIHTQQLSRSD
ncbi:hypothetical protein VNO80_11491 [Phaseolus coccineus]|uniref:Carbamoyl-phosphate synthase small subunit N-terminal domain-containing protein n=1 Tax=Phaseolus coccineus TaxID=3886 RepID=A0AAN9RKI1_PHACN